MKVTIKPLYSLTLTVQARGKKERHWLSGVSFFLMEGLPARIKWKHKWGLSSDYQGTLNSSWFFMDLCGHRERGKSRCEKTLSQSEENCPSQRSLIIRSWWRGLESVSAKARYKEDSTWKRLSRYAYEHGWPQRTWVLDDNSLHTTTMHWLCTKPAVGRAASHTRPARPVVRPDRSHIGFCSGVMLLNVNPGECISGDKIKAGSDIQGASLPKAINCESRA